MEPGTVIHFIKDENLICTNAHMTLTRRNVLNSKHTASFDIDMSISGKCHRPLVAFSSISVAVSRKIDTFKYVIDVFSITKQFEPLQLKGLHWQPKNIQINHDDTLLACLCDEQITVWNMVSGQTVQTFTNLSQNRSHQQNILSFGSKNFLHVYYKSEYPKLISYNMQNLELESYINFGYEPDVEPLQVYEKQNKKSLLFGDGYLAKINYYWKFSKLVVYTLKQSGLQSFYDGKLYDKTTITTMNDSEKLTGVSYDGKTTIAALFSNGLVKLFNMNCSDSQATTPVLKIFDTKLRGHSLIFYKEHKLACISHDKKTIKIWKF